MSESKTNLFETSNRDLSFNVWAVDIMSEVRDTLLMYPKAWTNDTGCKIKSFEAVEKCFEQAFSEALGLLECNMFYQFLLDCGEYYGIELDEESKKQLGFWIAPKDSWSK